MLQRCLKDLRERFAKIEIQASEPLVPFRETAIKAAEMAPPKTEGMPRGSVKGSSSHAVVTFVIRAAPLPLAILAFLQDNLTVIRKLLRDRELKEQLTTTATDIDNRTTITGENNSGLEMEEGITMYGDIFRKPTVRSEQFWSSLVEVCKLVGMEWHDLADKIWAFGPHSAGGCILIDARLGIAPNA